MAIGVVALPQRENLHFAHDTAMPDALYAHFQSDRATAL